MHVMAIWCLYISDFQFLMPAKGLIQKLLDAHAAEKRGRELTFTNSFGGYLLWSLCSSAKNVSTLSNWREILADFEPSLANLSDEEIEAAVMLLDYYLNRAEKRHIDNR
jgi:hypothetical protein